MYSSNIDPLSKKVFVTMLNRDKDKHTCPKWLAKGISFISNTETLNSFEGNYS